MNEPKMLAEAVWSGDLAAVDALLAAGADPDAADEDRWPPLHLAIEQQRPEIVHRLIAAGAAINRDLGQGWTPLAHAIDIESDAAWQHRHQADDSSTELTEFLLLAGAEPTDEALRIARAYDNRRALALLDRHIRHTPPVLAADFVGSAVGKKID